MLGVTDLLAARGQMAISLAFHIVFAVAGMAMPVLMVMAERKFRRTGDAVFRDLAIRWSKGTAILFAVGAVSGTVLSFELGLLWPTFMEHAGPLIGMPFSLEGFAFFLEAICLGLYLYGWERLSARAHLLAGIGVAISGAASGIFVMAVNAWMNSPAGFRLEHGRLVDVDPWRAMFNDAFPTQAAHMLVAAYTTVGFLVVGIHAFCLRRRPSSRLHREALRIALVMAVVGAPLQVLTGDLSAKHIAVAQPTKLAAAEGLFETRTSAPLTIGGWPDEHTGEVRYGVELPGALSFLAHGDLDAEVAGLDRVPRDEWPPIAIVHVAFQVMVGCGMIMLAFAAWAVFGRVRRRAPEHDRVLLATAPWVGPLGLVALEAGWVVTEVGRQPWIIHGVMRVADAVTPVPGLHITFAAITAVYFALGVVVLVMLRAHVLHAEEDRA
jgi:cytochrome d ubiquinol oxidase subunit I